MVDKHYDICLIVKFQLYICKLPSIAKILIEST